MKRFRLAFLTLWFLLSFISTSHAGPIAAAVGFLGSVLAGGGLGAAILKAVIGAALSVAGSLLQKAMNKQPEQEVRGVTMEVQMGDDHPWSFIIGKYAGSGKRKYIGTWGQSGKTPNAFLTDVLELSCLPSRRGNQGINSLWVDENLVTILWDEPHEDGFGYPLEEYRDEDGEDHCWVKFYDGTQTEADPWLLEVFSVERQPDRPFTEDMIGRGCQVLIITCRFQRKFFKNGLPRVVCEPQPMPLYDPREDSTVGGSGDQRWDDPETWGTNTATNNAVIMYNLARGIYYEGEWIYGGQNMSVARLPMATWFAAMNECDRAVAIGTGGTERQFRGGLEIPLDLEPLQALDYFRRGCNGRLAEVGGALKLLVGAPGSAVYSFTDEGILITEDQSFDPFPSIAATHNGIEATYPEPAERWTSKDAPPRYNEDWEEDDGNRRLLVNVELPATPYHRQVQRLMRAMIEEERRFRVHQFFLPPEAWALEPNDVVTWTSERNGYSNKKFIILQISGNPSFCQLVTIRELDPADFDWEGSYEVPVETGWLGPIYPPVQVLTGFFASAAAAPDNSGVDRRPAILVGCDAGMDDVRSVRVQVRLRDTGVLVWEMDIPYAEPHQWLITGSWCLPNEYYEVRGRFIPFTRRDTDYSLWIEVLTLDLLISGDDILDDAITSSKIADAAITAAKLMDGAVEELKLADRAVSTLKVQLDAIKTELIDNAAIVQSKIAAGAVGDAQLAALAVTAGKIAANAVTTTTIADDAITTPKIVANAIVADKIAANSVAVSKLIVANLENAFAGSEDPATTGWQLGPQSGGTFSTTVTYNGKPSSMAINGAVGTGTMFNYPSGLAVSEGEQYYISFMMRRNSTWNGTTTNSKLRFADQANSFLTQLTYAVGDGAANTWTKRELVFTVPAGISLMKPTLVSDATAGTVHLSDLVLRKMASSELIVDGAVIADKLAANSVTASKIVAGTITSTELGANSVTAVKIASSAVTSDKIAANSVTSDKIVANSITARELVLTDFENIIANGFFGTVPGSGNLDGWTIGNPSAISVQPGTARNPPPSPNIVRFNATTTQDIMTTAQGIQCAAGDKFHAQFDYAGSGGSIAGTFRMRIYWTDVDGNALSSTSLTGAITTTGWQTVSAEWTAPAGAVAIRRIEMARDAGTTSDGAAFVANLLVRRKKNSELIVDGAIIADKLATNSVTTSKIILNGVTTTRIAASAVTVVASAYTGGATADINNVGSPVDAQSVTISTTDADAVEIQFNCRVNQSSRIGAVSGSVSSTTFRIYRGGTLIATRNVTDSALIDSGGTVGRTGTAPTASISFSDTGLSASSYTYSVTAESNYGGGGTVTLTQRYLQAMTTKR